LFGLLFGIKVVVREREGIRVRKERIDEGIEGGRIEMKGIGRSEVGRRFTLEIDDGLNEF